MWIPKSEAEIMQAIESNAIEESVVFDTKRELGSKSHETAKDISAMANTNGGIILIGLAEDKSTHTFIPTPQPLKDLSERINSIVQTGITEPPLFDVKLIPSTKDITLGYAVIIVPPSASAPHMVVIKQVNRYYGRSHDQNTRLSESEVRNLYERREIVKKGIKDKFTEWIKYSEPTPVLSDDQLSKGNIFIYLRPTISVDRVIERALESRDPDREGKVNPRNIACGRLSSLWDEVIDASSIEKPNFARRPRPEWKIKAESYESTLKDSAVWPHKDKIRVGLDAAIGFQFNEIFNYEYTELFLDSKFLVAKVVDSLAFSVKILLAGKYFGSVDVGVFISGIFHARSDCSVVTRISSRVQYYEKSYSQLSQFMVSDLVGDGSITATERLLDPLFNELTDGKELTAAIINRQWS